ncbi:MAG: Type restriction enzyme protein [Pseudomonadota bacterium]|jgi:type I restriction enzyme R subunit
MNEAETRAEHIDPALRAAGWGVVEDSRVLREYGISAGRLQGAGQRARADIADYVLVYRNTRLAVVEAKAWDKPCAEGVAQAKRYAQKLAVRFAFATNGQHIYRMDMAAGEEGDVPHFPSPDALWAQTYAQAQAFAAAWRDRFATVPFEDKGGAWQGRYYQDVAIQRVLDALGEGRDRVLLTLATGTGKTLIAFQLAWKLYHARWNLNDWRKPDAQPAELGTRRPRILFLADRNILANQAFRAFSAFEDDALVRIEPDEIKKKGRVPKNGSVFFTIFQTFMSGPGDTPYFGDYPPDFFDLIVIDECHRGGANDESRWRDILRHFSPAVQLGLTATPKRTLNADTYAYFGEPVYVYSLKDGINDGFLTPFRVQQIATTLDDYVYTADDHVISGQVEPGRRYTEKDFNRVIEITARETHRVRLMLEMIDQREKTLVFCATQAHAALVRDLINQHASSKNPLYCVRVTANDGVQGEQYLEDFQDNEKTIPTVLTTSQKLSTGVDARNVRYIVLLRPLSSMIEFKQIIGRGTRLYDGKDYFTILDFVKAHHLFSDPAWDGEPMEPLEHAAQLPRPEAATGAPAAGSTPAPEPRPDKLVIRLGDGKARQIQHMSATSFWGADGKPLSPAQFLQSLFGTLPQFFKDEDQLRTLWADPTTRKQLLDGLADKGFGREPLSEMQRLVQAEHSDLFDVLAYVAFALPPQTRADRAAQAMVLASDQYGFKQQAFIQFVLGQYVSQGVEELAPDKLSPLLRLRYNNALADAAIDLGPPDQIRKTFVDFQRLLYQHPGCR